MNMVKGKDNGRLWKTKLLRRCGVALVNCDDEERFYRKSNKNRLCMVKAVTVFFVAVSETGFNHA
jgi:hypothetical protein